MDVDPRGDTEPPQEEGEESLAPGENNAGEEPDKLVQERDNSVEPPNIEPLPTPEETSEPALIAEGEEVEDVNDEDDTAAVIDGPSSPTSPTPPNLDDEDEGEISVGAVASGEEEQIDSEEGNYAAGKDDDEVSAPTNNYTPETPLGATTSPRFAGSPSLEAAPPPRSSLMDNPDDDGFVERTRGKHVECLTLDQQQQPATSSQETPSAVDNEDDDSVVNGVVEGTRGKHAERMTLDQQQQPATSSQETTSTINNEGDDSVENEFVEGTGGKHVERLTLDQQQQPPATSSQETTSTINNEDDDSQSRSAQLLLGRWNSWRQKANVAWKQNTEKALKSEVGQRWAARAEAAKRDAQELFRAQQQQRQQQEQQPTSSPKDPAEEQDTPLRDHATANPVTSNTAGAGSTNDAAETVNGGTIVETVHEKGDEPGLQTEGDEVVAVLSEEALERHGETSGDIAMSADDDDRSSTIWTDSSAGDAYQRALTAAIAARTIVADSVVATGFRGRYNGGTPGDNATPRRKGASVGGPVSQTSLILQSRAANHMQSILDDLDTSHEYVMLLGQGMLGVNLKQTYMRNHGVYIDYMLETGAAFASRVVHVGDTICKVGEQDVTRGTILDIPQTIAKSRRPVVLVCSTGQAKNSPDGMAKVDHVDLAIAMMHQIRRRESDRRATGISNMPLSDSSTATSSSPPHLQPAVSAPFDEANHDGGPSESGEAKSNEQRSSEQAPATKSTLESWSLPDDYSFDASSNPANVPAIPMEAKQAVAEDLPKRGLGKFSLSVMIQAAKTMDNFATALKYAFIACALDGRKLPFLSAHFSSEDALDATGDNGEDNEDYDEEGDSSQKATASTQLMLFLELTSYVELFDVTPETRRRNVAKRIANKFFLPSKVGKRTAKPMFDFSYIVGPSDLNRLIGALANRKIPLRRNLFTPFQNAVVQFLSRTPFLTFLMSTECARMRGYLRGTSPYRTVYPGDILQVMLDKTEDDDIKANAHAHLIFIVCFLLCQHEREMGGENDDILVDKGERLSSAANGLCCAVAIRKVLPKLEGSVSLESMKDSLDWLWGVFLAPSGGGVGSGLSHSNETEKSLIAVRSLLQEASIISADSKQLKAALSEDKLKDALQCLADDLIYDFTVNAYPKYREHKCHEWLCGEMLSKESQAPKDVAEEKKTLLPELPSGAVHRLLRKLDFPSGLSSHKPIRQQAQGPNETSQQDRNEGDVIQHPKPTENASVAIVFGSEDGTDAAAASNPALDHFEIRRYTECQLISDDDDKSTKLAVPPTLEGYAMVPPMRRSPFGNVVDRARLSADGWQSTLVSFHIPGDGGSSLYGVSLVLSKDERALVEDHASAIEKTTLKVVVDDGKGKGGKVHKVASRSPKGSPKVKEDGVEVVYDESRAPARSGAFTSPLTFASPEASKRVTDCSVRISMDAPVFNRKLEKAWTDRMIRHREQVEHKTHVTVGIILLSSENVVLAMRETLTRLLLDFGRGLDDKSDSLLRDRRCGPLVDLLGNFSHSDVESKALKAILEPYLSFGAKPWIDRPVGSQKREFDLLAGERLVDSIPPTPLALLFVALLLEQKVVFSSSQRSLLMSAVNGMMQLLQPVGWAHLVVPLVPSALAKDLLQYPAPFVVGIPSEDAGNIQLLSNLPRDVTLVDLDVGRVILAPSISYNDDAQQRQQGEDREATVRALRSQVLYLAQSLGGVFGNQLTPRTWKSDMVVAASSLEALGTSMSPFERLKATCRSFLEELLHGSMACAYWMEAEEPTVMFDEDRFFQIKNLRAQDKHSPLLFRSPRPDAHMLTLDDFDLILECFLRGQGLSTYISSLPKEEMAFC